MIRPGGYAIIVDPEAPTIEFDTVTCNHCQQVVRVKAGSAMTVYYMRNAAGVLVEEAGAFCRLCMAPICLNCHARGVCVPWEKQMEAMEARDRFLRSAGIST